MLPFSKHSHQPTVRPLRYRTTLVVVTDRFNTDSAISQAVAAFDLGDPGLFQNPYPVLDALRSAAPILWYEPTQSWLVTRHAEVHAALRDRRLGRVYDHKYTHEEFGRPEPDPRWEGFRQHERWSLLQLEPPDHTRIRSLISRAFTPGSISAMRPFMEQKAHELIQVCREKGTFDLLADYSQPYSVAVICALLGVPDSETQRLLDWSHAIVKMYELATPDEQRVAATTAAVEFMDFISAHIEQCRRNPTDGLLSRLVAAEEDGKRLTTDEIICTVIVLLNAGHEATVNTLGNGTKALLTFPDQWNRLTNGEVAADVAVEELLRFDAPLQLFERWVLDEGVVIAGQPLRVGEKIAMLFGSANRDERKFANAAVFDVGRGDPTHIGFGGGIHFCIGAPLARLEIEVALQTLVESLPAVTLAAEPEYHPTFVIHGLTALQLTVN